ncbi:MAG: penicillin-binding protein 2 [Kiritimatiellae bacterium]|nr:penicillin-binding protein 2 [Kiritimatiellia bacterium]
MSSAEQINHELVRLRVLIVILASVFVALLTIMWRVQVVNSTQYTKRLDRQSIRRVRLPGVRGAVYDRNGVCLAGNNPNYCVAIYIEELRQPGRWANTIDKVEEVIDTISTEFNIKREVTRKNIATHIQRRLPLPFLAWRNISPTIISRIKESDTPMLGVDIYVEPVRTYPQGKAASHITGYVGTFKPAKDIDIPYHYYLPEMEGREGIERSCNDILTGTAGGRLIRVDASGFKHDRKFEKEPVPGTDIQLTIDLRIQALAEMALHGVRGACVIVDPNNGDILAIASSPAFDLSRFTPRIPTKYWKELNDDKRLPLFNRAISGAYAPGSIFKPLVAIASLENKKNKATDEFDCPGYFELGKSRFKCWKSDGHGLIDMRKALEQSCNTYFFHVGQECGHEKIYHMAAAVGLGYKTGVPLGGESAGLLPNDAWKRARYNERWRGGDTCNFSIGQGALSVTPIQIALYTATIANGGTLYHPRLLLDQGSNSHNQHRWTTGKIANQLNWSGLTLETVRGGMFDVINAPTGTGKRALIPGLLMAGKTGTAEYGTRNNRKKNTWMILFAPYTKPKYAIAMIVEDGISGGLTVAPRLKRLMIGIQQLKNNEETG